MPSAAAVRREVRADFDMDDDDDDAVPFGIEEGMEGEGGEGEVEEEAPRINVDIPRCVAQLGSELYFVKLPNFLSVETRYAERIFWSALVHGNIFPGTTLVSSLLIAECTTVAAVCSKGGYCMNRDSTGKSPLLLCPHSG